ncbi:bifunctional diaminohydroxyphosphoribosylaminopyrimidine deaminase/5-amino-6-(5-phosphoribosylamino)uracil reductase RibD [Paenibacillus pasadenensis]|uniref:bifunctional diaminohydroxyphosphoribosylaminopyrimidine deaminase/5-amino-6-(5-phosphoribosylamino)uracil reductase RibD n=1 Tax=Paenibacillus pasadenensis TaxID=217090 RepID=UPI003EBFB3CB
METIDDRYYMDLALAMARKTAGQTSVNPVVGCVVVKEGRIVGMGAHLKRGEGHAEVHALTMAGEEARGATVFVTLEPCSHYGRTPPCSERIIASGASKVVVAAQDPNPLVAGSGIAKLRAAGLEVVTGVLAEESHRLNEAFNKFITKRQPFVTIKAASTLDGRIASKTGDSRWVTGPEARQAVHALRHRHTGIMIGIGTALADDPSLTTRLPVPGIHPVRIVADSSLRLPLASKLVQDRTAPTLVLAAADAPLEREAELRAAGVEVLRCGSGSKVDLADAMGQLAARDIGSILLEGGGKLSGSMLEAGLVDRIALFMAPKIIGGYEAPASFQFSGFSRMADAIELEDVELERYGRDFCISGKPVLKGAD